MRMIWIAGLAAPLCIIAIALLAYAVAGGAAAVVLLAIGFLVVVILNLRQINALARWADGDLDAFGVDMHARPQEKILRRDR